MESVINSINCIQRNRLPKLNVQVFWAWQKSLLFASRPNIIQIHHQQYTYAVDSTKAVCRVQATIKSSHLNFTGTHNYN